MERLPFDVLSNIFMRLPAKELSQMRCICKNWNALLSESSFVKSHLRHSINNKNKNEILLFFRYIVSFERRSISARCTRSLDLDLTNFIELPALPESKRGVCKVIGSVHGLICFYYLSCHLSLLDYVVYIWNPSLSAVLTLPPSSFSLCQDMGSHFRFGYDPKNDDYKVFKLRRLLLCRRLKVLPEVEVYSMRKGSWELITQRFPSHITQLTTGDDEVCADGHNGHLHWLGSSGLNCKNLKTIVAFNLGAETFREILLPDVILHRPGFGRFRVLKLRVFSGKLCVMSLCEMSTARNGECEVWVMNEYGVAESWVKHHVFGGDIVPYGFTSNNEFLFKENNIDPYFGLYDIVAAQTKTFQMNTRRMGIDKIVEYVDSIVWVIPAKHELSKGQLSNSSRQLLKGL